MTLLSVLALPFVASVIAALMPTDRRNGAAALAGLTSLACAVRVAFWFPLVADGGVLEQRVSWIPSLGFDLVLRLDGFSWLFCMLVFGIGALVVLYARYYLSPSDPVARFFAFFLAFMGAMAGVVLSGNLLQLAFFWELTSLFSFLLIGYWHHRKDARRGARMALTVTGAGGLALLAGLLVLGHIVGSYELKVVLASAALVQAHPLYPLVLGLMLLGAFTKSAQFPFHFWLPNAMAAPTPVSAYLHSATMVKAGVFLLARFWPVLSGTEDWFWIVGGTGLVTLLWGAWAAIFQNDLKGLLAYSTISHLGLITLLLGLNSPLAAVAAVFHIMNHAAFKASLFMAVGIIDHETGTRDIRRLSGLRRSMPITTALALVASAAMAGVPLLNGFLSKEMFFAETLTLQGSPWVQWGVPVLASLAGMFAVAYSLRFTASVFFGPSCEDEVPRTPHEPPRWMRVPVDLLVLLCLVVGIVPAASVGHLLDGASLPVVGGTLPAFSLAVWHGFNLPLLMSALAMAGGIGLYAFLRSHPAGRRWAESHRFAQFNGKRLFEHLLARMTLLARDIRRHLLTAGLQAQLLLLVLATVGVACAAAWSGIAAGGRPTQTFSAAFAGLWLVGAAGAVGAAWQAKFHRLAALMLASCAGIATSVTFVWFSAPDLALTQIMVEMVTTVLLLLGLRWLPAREEQRGVFNASTRRQAVGRRTRDLLISLSAGAGMAALAWWVLTRPTPTSVSTYFLEHSLTEGGGRNVVNVMLVDFRGFDTFGEVVVLTLVGLTVYALLRRFRPAPETLALPPQQRVLPLDLQTDLLNPRKVKDPAVGYLMVPAVLVRLILPVTGAVAVHLFLRGHNEPGGGFVAGLVFSVGFLLQYIVSGTEWVESHLRLYPRRLIGSGLLILLAAGGGSLLFGYPFLTSHTAHLDLPVLGETHLASAVVFDIGVFCVVVGATLLILTAIAHQSIRAHRAEGGE